MVKVPLLSYTLFSINRLKKTRPLSMGGKSVKGIIIYLIIQFCNLRLSSSYIYNVTLSCQKEHIGLHQIIIRLCKCHIVLLHCI